MKQMCIGDKFKIQCYKHNGKVHRYWDEATIIDMNKEFDIELIMTKLKSKRKLLLLNF